MNVFKQDKNRVIVDISVILIIYSLAHGMMLTLTGTFHDDWLSLFCDAASKDIEGFESGRPYYSEVVKMVWDIPSYAYRKIAFVLYLLSSIFLYLSLRKIRDRVNVNPLILTLLCIIAPINDARVLLANFPYAVGQMLFSLAMYLFFTYMENKKLILRVCSIAMFFLSFTLNSNLVMFIIILLYLHKYSYKKYIHYCDFILLPIVFFALNHILYPTYGSYADYNNVNIADMLLAVLKLPLVILNTMYEMIVELLNIFGDKKIAQGLSLILIILTIDIKKIYTNDSNRYRLILGLILLAAGVYSYSVVRNDVSIHIVGIQGRDAMQLGLGFAFLVSYFMENIKKYKWKKYICVLMIFLGIVHFNKWYVEYQVEWYNQELFSELVYDNPTIREGGNYIVLRDEESVLGDTRWYTLSAAVTKKNGLYNVFLSNGTNDISKFSDIEKKVDYVRRYPIFKNYNISDTTIDGVICYNSNIRKYDYMVLKYMEITDPLQYKEELIKRGAVDIIKRN